MKHRKIEKIILNFFRLLPILCILIFLLYVCLTGFKKEKTNTYDTTNIEQVIEEETIYTYDLDTITETYENITYLDNWQFDGFTGNLYFLVDGGFTYYVAGSGYFAMFYESGKGVRYVQLFTNDNTIAFYSDNENDNTNGEFIFNYSIVDNYYVITLDNFTYDVEQEFDLNNGYYKKVVTTNIYTDNYTIVNKIKYYMNDYVFKYTDTLFNNGINVPFNAFTNAINLNQYSIFYSYLKFSYLYLIYLLLIDFIYLFYNIIAFIPKWLVNEFEKRT